MAISFAVATQAATLVLAFVLGAAMVHRHSRGSRSSALQRTRTAVGAVTPVAAHRPATQIPLRGIDGIVDATGTRALLTSVERKTRLSSGNFAKDCLPVLESLAEFVQMLPASESHHHAHPGGLWQHLLEVADAALTFRAGMELPPGVSTEERKRLEHRWTYAVFASALLHDVGKPVTDVQVTLYGVDPRTGRAWTPMAGPMKAFGAHWYSVAFIDASERDYQAHAKLGAMLLHAFVPAHTLRWLADDSDVLSQLLDYLSGEAKDGPLGEIVKKADSDSVRRNLLQGPRTRFASARTRPLAERLMEALRRMLVEGASLPLNRPGAAGWVHDGKVWFVCARLADEVRNYLSQNESLQGIPGKDRNDRMFDTWQEYGLALSAPDGGAVWRVRVECDAWSPPDAFTVLCFPLDKLYSDPAKYPSAVRGKVIVVQPNPSSAATTAAPTAAPAAARALPPSPVAVASPTAAPKPPAGRIEPSFELTEAGPAAPSVHLPAPVPATPVSTASTVAPATPVPAAQGVAVPASVQHEPGPADHPAPAATSPAPEVERPAEMPMVAAASASAGMDDVLPARESAGAELQDGRPTTTPELGAPLRPREKGQRPTGAVGASGKAPSPAATAFMAWVAQSVGTGSLKYNEEGALVHFVPEGALLLTPEIFRRFLSEHEAVPDGPIAALRESHGEKAFARLQNEVAKSRWTVRNGDENMHYYAFVKADKSLSRTASFYLVGNPELFWNPVPLPNDRITRAPRPRRMALPAGAASTRAGVRSARSAA